MPFTPPGPLSIAGKHLRIHPVGVTCAWMRETPPEACVPEIEDFAPAPPEDRGTVRPWDGTGMSVFSAELGDWEGSGYGSLLYTPQVMPAMAASLLPWTGPADFKTTLRRLPDTACFLTIVRDTGEGEAPRGLFLSVCGGGGWGLFVRGRACTKDENGPSRGRERSQGDTQGWPQQGCASAAAGHQCMPHGAGASGPAL